MKRNIWAWVLVFSTCVASAQDLSLSEEENAVVAAILAKEAAPAKTSTLTNENTSSPLEKPTEEVEEAPEEEPEETNPQKCLTVAYIDIDEAFNAHPRTVAVKEQIRLKILTKEDEVDTAKELIAVLTQENQRLATQLRQIKPFYERVVVEAQELLPRPPEDADTLLLGNILNRLTFAGTDTLLLSPLNTPAQMEDIKARLAANKQVIAEREFFIDNYKYTTREEILKLEEKEVKEILQDIYQEIKSFAKKRNIGVVVRKNEVLYGQKPINVTKDFINRLKKAKKYRKRGK